jgi:phage-related baseplate assembly protein
MALIDLPGIDYVSEDVNETLNNMITVVEALLGRSLLPADPLRLFLQSQAALVVQQRTLINKVAKANLLRYAPSDVLDEMGYFTETTRLPATAAKTTVRFTLSAAQSFAVSIPTGTRVCNEGDPKRYFATTEYAEVPAGATTIDVPVTCTEAGALGNGYKPGQLNQLVDPIAYIASVTNVTESEGGTDEESDDAYRERIRTAPEAFSVAGPVGAYQYLAKTASSAIIDVAVDSPADGEVVVVPLLTGGEIPGAEILAAVEAIVNDKTRRPLTDKVTVTAPSAVSYNINLTYWVAQDQAADVTAIQAAVTSAIGDYVLWQKSRLGRGINPSELIRRVMAAGAYRVNVTSPVYTAIGDAEVAVAGAVTATYGGLADD